MIYVGSGILAEQFVHQADETHSTEWESVEFKHEDMLTGSYRKTNADGTVNTGYVSEQTEPFGQGISLEPPPVEPKPPTYEAYLFDAYVPKWQCSVNWDFYGGFNGLPDHCQNRVLTDIGDEM